MTLGDISDEQILHVGGAQFARGEAVRKVGRDMQLLSRDPPTQDCRTHVAVSRLFLSVNPNMIAVDIGGGGFLDHRIQFESDTPLELGLETLGGPPVAHEKVLQAGALATLTEYVGVAEDFGHTLYDGSYLIPAYERVQTLAKQRFSRQPASDPQ